MAQLHVFGLAATLKKKEKPWSLKVGTMEKNI